ncbi:MAG: M42 family peptidase [Anaerolineae bacterium]|nr:MAG: M42 family peptidase [Anaerolineae bacterium]
MTNNLRVQAPQLRLLERLTNACAVSGDEGAVRRIVLEEVKPLVDDLQVDALGNVLATHRGNGRGPRLRVMLAAHMDEVGFMITAADGEGIFRFDTVGGIDPRQLPGKPVLVGSEGIPGVIGAKPVHLTSPEERKRSPSLDAMRIDVGKENAGKVKVGDRVTFATRFIRLGRRSVRAKALDDRLGVATLIEILRHPPENVDILAAFTVQEEVGLRGAGVAAHALEPDLAIALDCTPAYDLPSWDGEKNIRYNTRLGAGPAIYVADAATLPDPRLIAHFRRTAEAEGIPYQLRQPGGGGTDAGAIHRRREGIPSLSLSVPGRYLHTAAGIVRVADWEHTLQLVHAALTRLPADILAAPRGE